MAVGRTARPAVLDTVMRAAGDYGWLISDRVLLGSASNHPTELMDLRGLRLALLEKKPETRRLGVAGSNQTNCRHAADYCPEGEQGLRHVRATPLLVLSRTACLRWTKPTTHLASSSVGRSCASHDRRLNKPSAFDYACWEPLSRSRSQSSGLNSSRLPRSSLSQALPAGSLKSTSSFGSRLGSAGESGWNSNLSFFFSST